MARRSSRSGRHWPRGRIAAPKSAATLKTGRKVDIAGGHIAAVHGARPQVLAPTLWLPISTRRDLSRSLAKTGSTCRRCSRQNRSTSAPIPQPAEHGASKATQRHGTWSLTHTQRTTTVLSKHTPSKQPLNPAKSLPLQFKSSDWHKAQSCCGVSRQPDGLVRSTAARDTSWQRRLLLLYYSSRAIPGSAGTNRTSTRFFRSNPASVLTIRTSV